MKTSQRVMTLVMLCFAASVVTAQQEQLSESYRGSQRDNVEYQKVAPIKVFDNLY